MGVSWVHDTHENQHSQQDDAVPAMRTLICVLAHMLASATQIKHPTCAPHPNPHTTLPLACSTVPQLYPGHECRQRTGDLHEQVSPMNEPAHDTHDQTPRALKQLDDVCALRHDVAANESDVRIRG